jgi:4'-phosphopantetheinyl transferase
MRADEVHVWRASLERGAEAYAACFAALADDERRRAGRFHFERDRVRYVVARGVLRDILGRLLRRPPSSLRFAYNEFGKPSLAGEAGGLRFNLAHSEGAAVYACALGREVGVDVEMWREDFAGMDLARRFFSAAEVRALGSQPPNLLTRSFFNCWTRKEAYIKALGEGLSHPLDSFAVTLAPGEPGRLVSTEGDPDEAALWSILDLKPFEGCAAALAVRGGVSRLCCWDWRPAGAAVGG